MLLPNTSPSPSAGRLRLLAALGATTALAFPVAARAQEAISDFPLEAAVTDLPTAAIGTADQADAIVVTGSRVKSDGMAAPVPVTVATAAEIETLSPGPLIAGLSQLPQFYGNSTVNAGSSRAGYGSLNLRGLGVNRTLTLLNGRRLPAVSAFGSADITLLPEAMIRSVETTTGGASAAYGSDAVAGVVNFLLDTSFTGLELSLQGGITDRGDNENFEASAAYGTGFGGGRGHLLLSAEYSSQAGIFSYEGRDWYQGWGTFGSGTTASPYRFVPNTISANATFDGRIYAPGTVINGLVFDADGNAAAFVPGTQNQGAVGTAPARTAGSGGDDLGTDRLTLSPDLNRLALFAYAGFEVSDRLTVFAQAMHGNTRTFSQSAIGTFAGSPATLTVFADNAYLPADLAQTMADNGIESFVLRRRGHSSDISNGYNTDQINQYIGTAGLEYDVGGGWSVNGFYQYGRSDRQARQFGFRLDRIFAALDAVDEGQVLTGTANGNIVCRVSLYEAGAAAFPGCVPINLFGRGNASAAAVDYVTGFEPGQAVTTPVYYAADGFAAGDELSYVSSAEKVNHTRFEQHFAELSAAGDLADLWAGPLSVAFGASWRREQIRQVIEDVTNPASNHDSYYPVLCDDPALGLQGVSSGDCRNTVGVQFSKVSNIRGSAEVWEGFGEALLPLLDTDSVSAVANGAVRLASYSGSGLNWAWKGGLEVGLFDALRLRGTYSRDVRAGNLSERFDKSGGTATIDDPRTEAVETQTVIRFAGGNPEIAPEKADTFTIGAVLQPAFLAPFSLSLDYYDIKIADAISQVGTQGVLNRCFLEGADEFCQLVTIDPATDAIVLVGDLFVNVAKARVRGLDAEASYAVDVSLLGGDETLALRGFASWLLERSETNSSGVTTDFAGQIGATQSSQTYYPYADFKATGSLTYRRDGFSALLQARHIGSGVQDVTLIEGVTIEDNSVDAVTYVDLRLGQNLRLGGRDAELFVMVTNLTDVDPPLTPSWSANSGQANQFNASVHDILGRRYTAGFTLKL